MKPVVEKIDRIVNICIVGAALTFVSSVGWVALLYRSTVKNPSASIEKGTKITIPGRDCSSSPQTLVLVLSTDCKYCAASASLSASFYRRLVSQALTAHSTRLLAVFLQATKASKEYLAKLDVKLADVQQAAPASVGAKGTPTLILVNASGVVIQSWEGLLPPNAETEILAYMK